MRSGSDDTPHRFRQRPKTARYRARVAMRPGGPGARLMNALGSSARFWTMRPRHLDLPDDLEAPELLCDKAAAAELFAALSEHFQGPLFGVLEVGEGSGERRGRLHLHAIAAGHDGPDEVRGTPERCKVINDAVGLFTYLNKPAERWSIGAEGDYRAARVMASGQRLPNTRRYLYGPERWAWLEGNPIGTKRESVRSPSKRRLSPPLQFDRWEGELTPPRATHGAHVRGPDLAPRRPTVGEVVRGLRLQRLDRRAPRRLANTTAWKDSLGPPATAPPPTGATA